MTCAFKQNSGFTLIEALVTMVLLASGLLGMIALQAKTLKFNQNAYLRTQATMLAYDMADRIRANPVESSARASVKPSTLANSEYLKTTPVTNPPLCNKDNPCNDPVQMAQKDRFDWQTNIANTLPGGSGTITLDAANPIMILTITWDDNTKKEGDPAPTDESYANKITMSFQL